MRTQEFNTPNESDMHLDEHENLTFRKRPDRQSRPPPRRSSTWPWLVVGVIAAVLFVFVVRALLEKTAWTAGASPVAEKTQLEPVLAPSQDFADVSEFQQPQGPSVYRCVDRAGAVSFQSQPCGPDQRTTKVVAAPPEPEPIRQRQTQRTVSSRQSSYSTYQLHIEDSLAPSLLALSGISNGMTSVAVLSTTLPSLARVTRNSAINDFTGAWLRLVALKCGCMLPSATSAEDTGASSPSVLACLASLADATAAGAASALVEF